MLFRSSPSSITLLSMSIQSSSVSSESGSPGTPTPTPRRVSSTHRAGCGSAHCKSQHGPTLRGVLTEVLLAILSFETRHAMCPFRPTRTTKKCQRSQRQREKEGNQFVAHLDISRISIPMSLCTLPHAALKDSRPSESSSRSPPGPGSGLPHTITLSFPVWRPRLRA